MKRHLAKATTLGSAALALSLAAGPVFAQDEPTNPLEGQVMYGIDRDTSELIRYDFATGQLDSLGAIRDQAGDVVGSGINGAAYAHGSETLPSYTNIFAFRWDSAAYRAEMLWVDVRTGVATVGNERLEGGPIGGATAVLSDSEWNFYAVQHEQVSPPFHIEGTIANINPNNSSQMAFELVKENGEKITRADLLNATHDDLDADGTYWEGSATQLRIRPKGNGNQNQLTVTYPGQEPEPFDLRNSNTYVFTGTMSIRLYNDQDSNGANSMGHWWIEMDGSAYLNDEVDVLNPHRLVHVAHQEDVANAATLGTVTELAQLDRPYDSLASQDGVVFYATHGDELWMIDISDPTIVVEERIDDAVVSVAGSELLGMDPLGDKLYAYEVTGRGLHQVDVLTGERESSVDGAYFTNLGTIMFCPVENDRFAAPNSFD